MINRLGLSLVLVVSTFVAACSGTSDSGGMPEQAGDAIVGGHADKSAKDAAVVALLLDRQALCSGTFIAPNAVLTARHCVSFTAEQLSCPARHAQVLGERDPKTIDVLSGEDVKTAAVVAHGSHVLVPSGDVLCENDIAVLVLDRDVAGITPATIATAAPKLGEKLRIVGYGKRTDQGGAGKKVARSNVEIGAVGTAEFVIGEGSCSGDSGGPAFDEKTGAIVGVVSRGRPECQGDAAENIYTRTDVFADLIGEALRRQGGTPGSDPDADGDGHGGATDHDGDETGGSGGKATSARTCDTHHHCPKGEHCDATRHVCTR